MIEALNYLYITRNIDLIIVFNNCFFFLVVGTCLKRQNKENINDVRKKRKSSGLEYLSRNNKTNPAKKVQDVACMKKICKNKCSINFNEDDRQKIFETYWKLGYIEKRMFILNNSEIEPVKRRYLKKENCITKERGCNYIHFLSKSEKKIKVCQQFFIKTLDISQKLLQYTLRNRNEDANIPSEDKRGKKEPANKTSAQDTKAIKSFIEMLPALPSHYNRANTTKKYLPTELKSMTNVYRLYEKDCVKNNISAVKVKVFMKTIKKYNIGIHAPKKDKCPVCEGANTPPEEHLAEKAATKSAFAEDQIRGQRDPTFLCVSFDLQKVLNTPHGESMLLYYSRKYAMYNMTFYESITRKGYCFLWGEMDGKRGANEICSILFNYLNAVDQRGATINLALYCDSCPGQNKNRQVMATILFFLNNVAVTVKTVTLNFLLPGHTYMPVDSMHACIESNYRKKIIWAPSEWPTIVTNARVRPENYEVSVLDHTFFKNWKKLQDEILPEKTKLEDGSKLTIKNLRRVFFIKNEDFFKVSKSFCGEDNMIKVMLKKKRSCATNTTLIHEPQKIYDTPLGINPAKYKDLMNLCSKGIIPGRYHDEYKKMKTEKDVQDALMETDEEDF